MGLSLDDVNPEKNDLISIFEKFGKVNLTASKAAEIFSRRTVGAALIFSNSTKKMKEFKNSINSMESKYGCDYKSFITLSVNKDFREKILLTNDDWKKDLLSWEKNTEELSLWVQRVAKLIHDF